MKGPSDPSAISRASPTENLPVDDGYGGLVERRILAALAEGRFDDLPGSGLALPHRGEHDDPEWWARRKIEALRSMGAST